MGRWRIRVILCLTAGALTARYPLGSPAPGTVITYPEQVYLDISGQPLLNFFEGRPVALVGSTTRPARTSGGTCGSLARSLVRRFGLTTTVHAQVEPWCYEETWCAGSYWVDNYQECLPHICEGRFNWGRTDYERGDRCRGIMQAGYSPCTARDIFSSCDCAWRTCDSCRIEP
jgi:hypothetical protein